MTPRLAAGPPDTRRPCTTRSPPSPAVELSRTAQRPNSTLASNETSAAPPAHSLANRIPNSTSSNAAARNEPAATANEAKPAAAAFRAAGVTGEISNASAASIRRRADPVKISTAASRKNPAMTFRSQR